MPKSENNPLPQTPGALLGHRRDGRPIFLAAGGAPEDTDTTATGETGETGTAPAPHTFPFDVPADLAAATDEQLLTVLGSLRDYAAGFANLTPAETTADTIVALEATRQLATAVSAERNGRRDRAAQAQAFAADILSATAGLDEPAPGAEFTLDETVTDPEGDGGETAPAAVTAARRPAAPSVRQVARNAPAAALPPEVQPTSAVMTASVTAAGFNTGQRLERFADAAKILSARIDQYPSMTASRAAGTGPRRPVTAFHEGEGRQLVMKNFVRHEGIQIQREFPEALRLRDGAENGYAIAEYAALERRLPGGSLIESAKLALKKGRALTAAAGWCAPSEVIYDLCELETIDGILDLPEMQTSRGGWQIPTG